MDTSNFIRAFEGFGQYLYNFFGNVDSMYAATFIFFMFLIYSILLALVGKVPSLGDGKKANRYGKGVALAIAAVSTFSIFRLGQDKVAQQIVTEVLTTYGIFAGVVMAFLFFGVIYFGLGNKEEGRWHLGVIASGFAMAVAGYTISKPMVQGLGWFIGVIGLILYISTAGLLTEASSKADK